MKFKRTIEKLDEDVQHYTAMLIEAKCLLLTAQGQGAVIRAKRLENRIKYFENRIAVSKSELARHRALYDMRLDEMTKSRLIAANKFFLTEV